jgi:hypothetical protein
MPVQPHDFEKTDIVTILSREDRHTAPFVPFEKGSDQDIERSALFDRVRRKNIANPKQYLRKPESRREYRRTCHPNTHIC